MKRTSVLKRSLLFVICVASVLLIMCSPAYAKKSSIPNGTYTTILVAKGGSSYKSASLAYLDRCKLSGRNLVMTGEIKRMGTDNRLSLNNSKVKLSKNVKYRSANIEDGESKMSRSEFAKLLKVGALGLDIKVKGGKIVKLVLHA